MQEDSIADDSDPNQEIMPTQPTTESHPLDTTHLPIRHSTRPKKPPSWLSDFTTNCASDNHSLLNMCSISNAHTIFLTNLSHVKEPHNYKEACKSNHWVKAMHAELEALERNRTWGLCLFLKIRNPLD